MMMAFTMSYFAILQIATLMAHRIEDISWIISAGIVVYRRMQETVQTQYGMLHPPSPEEEDHVPLHKYYGKYSRSMMEKGLKDYLYLH